VKEDGRVAPEFADAEEGEQHSSNPANYLRDS